MPHSAEHFPANWYPAPDDSTKVRYWDGHRWTEHVALRDPSPKGSTAPASGVDGSGGAVARRPRIVAIALLTTPVLGFFLPFIGPAVSAGAAYLARGRAPMVLWTRAGWPHSHHSAVVLGFAALWLLPGLNILALLGLSELIHLHYLPGLASWLFLPLAGPADFLTPAAVALIVYAAGAALSAWRRRPWPWILGGILANLAYDLTIIAAAIPWIS